MKGRCRLRSVEGWCDEVGEGRGVLIEMGTGVNLCRIYLG